MPVHPCAHSRLLPVRAVRLAACARGVRCVRSRFVLCRCASAGRLRLLLRLLGSLGALPLLPLVLLWDPSGLRRPVPALPYAGRLARCGIAAALPRSSRGSVTIVCYNQSSALRGIAYNLSSMV